MKKRACVGAWALAISSLFILASCSQILGYQIENEKSSIIDESASFSVQNSDKINYVSRAPIRIDSNADFTAANGVTAGDGTQGNPYIFENYDINGTYKWYCIYIGNTTDYFVVRNCNLHDANCGTIWDWPSNFNMGVCLYNASNCIITNNTISSNCWGIYLSYSSSVTIINNTMMDNGIFIDGNLLAHWNTHSIDTTNTVNGKPVYYLKDQTEDTVPSGAGQVILANCTNVIVENQNVSDGTCGIELGFSSGNTLANNTASSNTYYGIFLYSSGSNTIANNTVSNNWWGICMRYTSSTVTVTNNTMMDNGIFIEGSLLSQWNIHSIDTTNTVNGKPVYYWKNQTGGIVPSGAGQVILANCTNVIVENQNVSDGTCSIELGFSSGNTLANNTASSNWFGIYLYSSSTNIIANNTANSNYYGFYITLSPYNRLENNSLISSIRNSMFVLKSNNCIIAWNIVNTTEIWCGIFLKFSSYANINNNTVTNIYCTGIYLECFSDHCTVRDNVANDNGYGIELFNSSYNLILNNTANSNLIRHTSYGNYAGHGILLQAEPCEHNIITNNRANYNEANGIYFYVSCNYNKITNNTIVSNSQVGIFLNSSHYNTLYNNSLIANTYQAIDNSYNNFWNGSYSTGGNYWSDYIGVDVKSGPLQDRPGSDGIGDTPFIVDFNSQDNYPLMSPFAYTEYCIPLHQGWNLISLPLRQLNGSIDAVLESIAGKWDYIQTYDAYDVSDHWKSNMTYRPESLNNLRTINHLKSYWINITEPGVALTNKGDMLGSAFSIPLKAGWNLVGYPSLVQKSISDALTGTGYDSAEGFNASDPYRTCTLPGSYMMKPGEGYWVHVPADTVWIVNW